MKKIFDFGRNNRLYISDIVDDFDYDLVVGKWISGRIFGKYISFYIPKLIKKRVFW